MKTYYRVRTETRLTRSVLAVTVFSSAVLIGCAEAGDDGASFDDSDLSHPEDDTVGSQVRLHEGTEAPSLEVAVVQTSGDDVSAFQGAVNWAAVTARGARFVYIKATEGTGYRNSHFAQQYNGSFNAGMIRGAYHFALPDRSSGAVQGNFFVNHGGGWSNDGKTLPPAIDLEYNPYGSTCYGLSKSAMVAWIRDIVKTVKARTRRDPVLYTSTDWWTRCTGNNATFGDNPLWIPHYGSSVGRLPASWKYQTIWQSANSGVLPGDQDKFNGAYDRLQAFAR